MSHAHRSTHGLSSRTAASRTRADLLEELTQREAEAGAYLSMLVPALHRLGGEIVLTEEEATSIPDGVTVWQQQAEPGVVRFGLKYPEAWNTTPLTTDLKDTLPRDAA